MKITEAIKVFKTLLPIYEKVIETKYVPDTLKNGLCYATRFVFNDNDKIYYKMIDIFGRNGYYNNFTNNNSYLFKTIYHYDITESVIKECLVSRLEFLKTEIKSLQKLLDNRYTDI